MQTTKPPMRKSPPHDPIADFTPISFVGTCGFFLFSSPKPPQCDQINTQITRMRSNLDRMISEMNQKRGGSMDLNRDLQRRQIIAAASILAVVAAALAARRARA